MIVAQCTNVTYYTICLAKTVSSKTAHKTLLTIEETHTHCLTAQ